MKTITRKLLVEKQAEILPYEDHYEVRLVRYYHDSETEYSEPRGNFKTYKEAHDFAMWWRKQK